MQNEVETTPRKNETETLAKMRKDLDNMLGEEYKTLQLDEAIMKKESPHGAVTQATGGREGSTKRTA